MIVPLKTQQIAMFNETPPIATQYELRPLLALSDQPVAGFEQVPTAKSLGIAARGSVWGGLVAPKGLPAAVRDSLEQACKTATASAAYKARAATANNPLVWRTGAEFKAFSLSEHDKFKQLVKQHNLFEK
jgi:tripartite-type tricarboxylate transporter receptor subunit TctC